MQSKITPQIERESTIKTQIKSESQTSENESPDRKWEKNAKQNHTPDRKWKVQNETETPRKKEKT